MLFTHLLMVARSDPLQRASRGMLQMHSTRAALVIKKGGLYVGHHGISPTWAADLPR